MRSRIPAVLKLVARLLLLLVGALCFSTGAPTLHAEEPDPCGVPQEQASSAPVPQPTLNAFKYVKKSIIYPVCLRGLRGILAPSNFIVDTGTNRTILDQEVARMLQLPEVGTANIVAPGGTVSAAKLVEAEIRIEGEHFSKLTVSVQNLSQYSRAHKTSIAGLLGTDLIRQYVLFIDYSGRRIGFFRALPKLDGFEQLATVPFRSEKGMLLIECSLSEAIQTEVMIDTGHILDLQLYEDVAHHLKLEPAVSHRRLG
jgi:predicted aspartyl protease